jgi:hypothetical protein
VRWSVGILVALAAPAAHAGKPTDAQAKAAAASWIAALDFKGEHFDSGKAASSTGLPFQSVMYDDDGLRCADATAKTDASRGNALQCLHDHADGHGRLRPWNAKAALHLTGPLRQHLAGLKQLAKTETLVIIDDGCESRETTLILAVATDSKAKAHVTAALAQDVSCGE